MNREVGPVEDHNRLSMYVIKCNFYLQLNKIAFTVKNLNNIILSIL